MTTLTRTHTFTVDDYHRMAEAGILGEDDRVELIEGEIVDMTPIGNPHLSAVDRLNDVLTVALSGKAIIRVQGSVRLNNVNEPQPDIVVLRRRDDFYARTTAGTDDTLLVIEVSDSSLAWDRDVKAPLYARTGIPEFWLVDVNAHTITVFREPGAEGYGSSETATGKDRIAPLAFPEFVITPDDIIL